MTRVLKSIVRLAWRWLNRLRRLIFFLLRASTIFVICVMLLLNVATLTISSVNATVSAALSTLTGLSTIGNRQADLIKETEAKASKLSSELQDTRSKLSIEQRKSANLAKKYGSVEVEARRLRTQGPDVKFRGKTRSLRSVAEEVTGSVSKRTAKVAATNVGSMTGEGIPFWGIAVIVAATTVEAAAACETMKDMRDLQKALDPDADVEERTKEVCGMRIPNRDEIWQAIKNSPSAAWSAASGLFDNLPSPDFGGWWSYLASRLTWE